MVEDSETAAIPTWKAHVLTGSRKVNLEPACRHENAHPPHPGDFIRTEIIEPLGLSVTGAAEALQVSRPALSSLLNGKAGLSGAMALRIEKAFGVKIDTLIRMQSSFDIAKLRKRQNEIRVLRYQPAEARP
jgi:addiction module HigA family antidote